MKAQLDAIWNDSKIACPNHIALWNTRQIGHSVFKEFGLWFTKGKRIRLLFRRAK